MFLSVLTAAILTAAVSADPGKTDPPVLASMLWSRESGFRLVEGSLTRTPETVARANFTNAVNATGWSYLEVDTEEKFPDKVQVGDESFFF